MYCRRRGEKGACSARSKKHTQVPAERAPKLSEGGGCLDFATGLSSLLYVLTPELVLFGGGLSGASHHFLPAVWREVEQRVMPESRQGLSLRRCALGNGAGRLGAAWLAFERFAPMPPTD